MKVIMGNAVGRPRKISYSYFIGSKRIYSEIKTRRGILSKYYMLQAFYVIEKMEDVKFLVGIKQVE